MGRQQRGLKIEHEWASQILEHTDQRILPLRSGWSGNQSVPSPDLLIPMNGLLRAVEIKTSSQKRMTIEQEDIEEVIHWATVQTGVPAVAYLVIKFPYYKPEVVRLDNLRDCTDDYVPVFEHVDEVVPFDTNVTRSGNLTIGNPSDYDTDIQAAQQYDYPDGVSVYKQLNKDQEDNKLLNVTDITRRIDHLQDDQLDQ